MPEVPLNEFRRFADDIQVRDDEPIQNPVPEARLRHIHYGIQRRRLPRLSLLGDQPEEPMPVKKKSKPERPEVYYLPVILKQLDKYIKYMDTGEAADFYEHLVDIDGQIEKLRKRIENKLPE